MANVIVDIKNLKRDFKIGDEMVKALNDVSFSINTGEFVTIMGSSGSGKTTLLNILGCLEKPTQGTYLLDGINVSNLSKNELARLRNKKLGFVFQSYNLLARTSAIENVELPLLYNNEFSAAERKEKAIAALDAVKLKDRMHHLPSQLSGGQQARFQVLLLELSGATLLLLDEPTDNLDLESADALQAGLEGFEGTVVAVTHDRWFAGGFDRFLHLGADGTVRETPEPVWDGGRLDPRLRGPL